MADTPPPDTEKPKDPTLGDRWMKALVDSTIKRTANFGFLLGAFGLVLWGAYEVAKPRIAREIMALITEDAHFEDAKAKTKDLSGFVVDTYKTSSQEASTQIAYFDKLGANLKDSDLLKSYAKGVVQALVKSEDQEEERKQLRNRIRQIINEEVEQLEEVRLDMKSTNTELRALLDDSAVASEHHVLRDRIKRLIKNELQRIQQASTQARQVDSILRERFALFQQYFAANDSYCQNKEQFDPLLELLPGRRVKEDITFYAHPGQRISVLANEARLLVQTCNADGKLEKTWASADLEVVFQNGRHNFALNEGPTPKDITDQVDLDIDGGLQPVTIGIQYREDIKPMHLVEAEIIILVENVDTKRATRDIIADVDTGLGN